MIYGNIELYERKLGARYRIVAYTVACQGLLNAVSHTAFPEQQYVQAPVLTFAYLGQQYQTRHLAVIHHGQESYGIVTYYTPVTNPVLALHQACYTVILVTCEIAGIDNSASGAFHQFQLALQLIGHPGVITVKKSYILSLGLHYGVVAGYAGTAVPAQTYQTYPGIRRGVGLHNRRTVINGAIIGNDHLPVGIGLCQD